VGKEVADGDHRAGGRRPPPLLNHLAPHHPDVASHRVGAGPGDEGHVGGLTNGCQGLPPKSEGDDAPQVGKARKFAGGVPVEGQAHLGSRDPRAVVLHPDQVDATPPDFDLNLGARRPGRFR